MKGIASPMCSEGNLVTSKIGAGIILKTLLAVHVDLNSLPEGDERGTSIQTITPVVSSVKESNQIIRY
jgi:hypothetical protein